MLFHGRKVFINGETAVPGQAAARPLTTLADARELIPPFRLSAEAWQFLYAWYLAGYIAPGSLQTAQDHD
jgi:hypothetical protein